MLIPAEIDLTAPRPNDLRVGHLIGTSPEPPAVVLIGFPSDAGVALNGGRTGAAEGPDAIRRALFRMTPGSAGYAEIYPRVKDLGNLKLRGKVADDQKMLAEAIAPYVKSRTACIILGGGHETAYGHYLGYVRSDRAPGIINWDAHPDVRTGVDGSPTSGSSFFHALTHETHPTPSYTVAGLLAHAVAESHVELLNEHSCEHVWRDGVDAPAIDEIYSAATNPTMVSFDLDAIDQAHAPGVSAPSVGGMHPDVWFHAAYGAGLCSSVNSIDVCELSPRYDSDDRTARIAALTIWHFLTGFATRLGIQRFVRSK